MMEESEMSRLGISGNLLLAVLLCVAVFMLFMAIRPAPAQSTGAVPLSDRGRFHGYVSSRPHWCKWSAAKVCTAWRARGGKFNCAPGNMSMSCRLQRGELRLR
jgi:hypothetical protein